MNEMIIKIEKNEIVVENRHEKEPVLNASQKKILEWYIRKNEK